jgi:hypothetical protein
MVSACLLIFGAQFFMDVGFEFLLGRPDHLIDLNA